MKALLQWVLVLAIATGASSSALAQASPVDQIRPLLNEQMLAANAHDTDRFLATYRHDDGLLFASNGEIIRGWNNLRTQQLKWWNNGKSDVVYSETAPPEFSVLGPQTALVTQQMAAHRTLSDGKSKGGRFVVTTIWQQLPAGWKVTYCHESWTQ
jgi:ketosteroid isomerase-like protein